MIQIIAPAPAGLNFLTVLNNDQGARVRPVGQQQNTKVRLLRIDSCPRLKLSP